MTEQQNNPKRSIALPAVIAVLAIAAFAAAFYLLDGMSLVDDLLNGDVQVQQSDTTTSHETTSSGSDESDAGDAGDTGDSADNGLVLPEGVTEEFALRIWQEQIDSQANINRLVDGEITRIVVTDLSETENEAVLDITAEFSDGTSAPGKLGMHKFGETWYFAYVSGMRPEDTGGYADDVGGGAGEEPDTDLPSIDDVDVAVLNTILQQQENSASVLEEYATGMVESVLVDEVVLGPDTATLKIVMNEDHETGVGQVVAISKEIDGENLWFIARFTKQESE